MKLRKVRDVWVVNYDNSMLEYQYPTLFSALMYILTALFKRLFKRDKVDTYERTRATRR